MAKKLYRSVNDRKLFGVAGGLGEYFDVDSTLIRLLWVLLAFFSCGAALLGYLVCAIVIPQGLNEIHQPHQPEQPQQPEQ